MIRRRVDGVQRDNLAIELSPDVVSMAWESPRRFSVCGAFASTKLGPARRASTRPTRAERRRDGRRRRPRLFTRGATDEGAVARPAAGCAAAVPGSPSFVTIGSEVLINSKTGFDLPTLVLDEVQTLSAVCGRHYRVSLPMRRARAFPHESKTFGERERELRTRRWRGGCLTN